MSFGCSIAGLFRFHFVICTSSSFVGSKWASGSILDLRLWRTSLSHVLVSGWALEDPLVMLGVDLCSSFLVFFRFT